LRGPAVEEKPRVTKTDPGTRAQRQEGRYEAANNALEKQDNPKRGRTGTGDGARPAAA